jgi:PhnB protein
MQIRPYLFFCGRCEEALNFYRATLGAEVVMLTRFSDSPLRISIDDLRGRSST